MTNFTVERHIREFIIEYFYVTDPAALTDETSLIDSGLVDSTGMMGVILHLEQEFGIEIGDRDATPENLDSIRRIAEFVKRRSTSGP